MTVRMETAASGKDSSTIMKIDKLSLSFQQSSGSVTALRNVSLQLKKGEILGLVGESGSGKSLTVLSLMKLLPANARFDHGDIELEGVSLKNMPESGMRGIRGNTVSMIFQEPMTALNPLIPVGRQIEELFILHKKMGKSERKRKVIDLLKSVGISEPEVRFRQYPFELSGGMRQRVMIAMALACSPKMIIADEPTTALDVTIQSQILDLLKDIKRDYGTSILLITHDMGVIADAADRVAVMYAGQLMELAAVDDLIESPRHPYTVGLLNSIPDLTGDADEELSTIPGSVPDLKNLPNGCPFHPRCAFATDLCREQNPELIADQRGHAVACWNPVEGEFK
ncbi:ATP-binding cassette domain-containing protein [Paenibacillus sp. LMG 31456]|uniref:ATP-binding cassette domain-containing protein n=1 Tax=Paenibacillus foliorum TaxID=2654974 RepID=A0A972GSB7_9BACL|nr:ABC transporter ATP-binding protein [Paenibacillus foliorum]NOU95944.1 ATP-binding cassette domain-containing protein [Paenibacillus foliorum]